MNLAKRIAAGFAVVVSLSIPLAASGDTYCNWNSQGTCCKCRTLPNNVTVCASAIEGWAIVSCAQLEFGCQEVDQTPCFAGWCDPYYGPGC